MPSNPPLPLVGLDVGTSSVKVLALAQDGSAARVRLPLPPPAPWNALSGNAPLVQDPMGILRVVEAALVQALRPDVARVREPEARAVAGGHPSRPGPDMTGGSPLLRVALATQRDTLLLAQQGAPLPRAPLTPLLSWRERAHLEDPVLRARILSTAGDATLMALPLEAWLPPWLEGSDGPLAARGVQMQVRWVGGDKNCEYLAMGVHPGAPGLAGISLGSAISLGVAVAAPALDPLPSGVVASAPPGGARGVHLETGILSGMSGRGAAAALAGTAPFPGPLPRPDHPGLPPGDPLRIVPWFGGALDDLDAHPRLLPRPDDLPATLRLEPVQGPARVARAWARGVAEELARLLPRVEAAAGEPITRIRVGGGGAGDPAWPRYLGEALGRPVEVVTRPAAPEVGNPGAWLGAWGALLASGWLEAGGVPRPHGPPAPHSETPNPPPG